MDADFLFNEKKLNINRLPARASIVPAQKEGIYYTNKEESEFVFSLNGEYDFKYSPDNDPNEDFYSVGLDTGAWDKLTCRRCGNTTGTLCLCTPTWNIPFPLTRPMFTGRIPRAVTGKNLCLIKCLGEVFCTLTALTTALRFI